MLVKLTSTTIVASDCNIGRRRPTPTVAETNYSITPCTLSAHLLSLKASWPSDLAAATLQIFVTAFSSGFNV